MIKNWSKWKTKQINLQKAVYNQEVSNLTEQNYKYLHNLLVKTDEDNDTFNDTFIKVSREYNPDVDFIQQYLEQFKRLKGQYYRYDKCNNYQFSKVESYTDKQLNLPEPEVINISSNEGFIQKIKDYAISEKIKK